MSEVLSLAELSPPDEDQLLVVVGPTASGKTEFALQLAERFDGEIVSADSVQIYRRFDVGSGKPTPAEFARAPHHLIDCIDPGEPMDAGLYASRAEAAIVAIRAKNKFPILCGGTFLWIKAVLWGLAGAGPRDEAIRARHRTIIETEGRAALYARLLLVDSETAVRLAPNDSLRVSRALEVSELTGKPMSAWQKEHAFAVPRHRFRLLEVQRDRSEIDARIEQRVDQWLKFGWVEEVLGLLKDGFGDTRAMASVGYKQVHANVRGELASSELQKAIVSATRVFARRQRTWLRDQTKVVVQLP